MENKLFIDSKNLLLLNKLKASGTRIAHKEQQNEEIPSCVEENKNYNMLDQLKLVLAEQSVQT